jgi:hypothetical protein
MERVILSGILADVGPAWRPRREPDPRWQQVAAVVAGAAAALLMSGVRRRRR